MDDHGGGGLTRTMGVYRQKKTERKINKTAERGLSEKRMTDRNKKTEPNREMKETK